MIQRAISQDIADLLFRLLFSSIFLALGFEHLFRDQLIQSMMPTWVPWKRLASLACGITLVSGGSMILLGWKTHFAASLLGFFLIIVTVVVHLPGMLEMPPTLPSDWHWLWDLYQRSNFIKNVCLFGACFHLLHYEPGRYSVDGRVS